MISKVDIDHQFESAETCLSEADEALSSFTRSLADFATTNKPAVVADPEAKTGNLFLKVRYPTFPKTLRGKAYRVAAHSRDALDQAVHAATICLDGKVRGTSTYFPFARDPNDFDTLFVKKGRCQHVSPHLIPTLKGFEPWNSSPAHAGGNDFLRYLGKISGPNKHQVGLYPIPNIPAAHSDGMYFEKVIRMTFPPEHVAGTNDFIVAVIPRGAQFKYHANLSFGVSLSQPSARMISATSDLASMAALSRKLVIAIKDFVATEIG